MDPSPGMLFGDLLALARLRWVREMASRLDALGYPDYRRTDASVLGYLRRDELTIGHLGATLGVTRQAARHVVDGLEARGYARTTRDARDTRRVRIALTAAGRTYANAVVEVIHSLNLELTSRMNPEQLDAARDALRAIVDAPSPLPIGT